MSAVHTLERSRVTRFARATRALTAAVIVVGSMSVSACGGDSTSPDNQPEFGHYTVVTVNGQPLPFTVSTGAGTVVVQSATLDLNSASPSPLYTAVINGTTNGAATQISDGGT